MNLIKKAMNTNFRIGSGTRFKFIICILLAVWCMSIIPNVAGKLAMLVVFSTIAYLSLYLTKGSKSKYALKYEGVYVSLVERKIIACFSSIWGAIGEKKYLAKCEGINGDPHKIFVVVTYNNSMVNPNAKVERRIVSQQEAEKTVIQWHFDTKIEMLSHSINVLNKKNRSPVEDFDRSKNLKNIEEMKLEIENLYSEKNLALDNITSFYDKKIDVEQQLNLDDFMREHEEIKERITVVRAVYD